MGAAQAARLQQNVIRWYLAYKQKVARELDELIHQRVLSPRVH